MKQNEKNTGIESKVNKKNSFVRKLGLTSSISALALAGAFAVSMPIYSCLRFVDKQHSRQNYISQVISSANYMQRTKLFDVEQTELFFDYDGDGHVDQYIVMVPHQYTSGESSNPMDLDVVSNYVREPKHLQNDLFKSAKVDARTCTYVDAAYALRFAGGPRN